MPNSCKFSPPSSLISTPDGCPLEVQQRKEELARIKRERNDAFMPLIHETLED